jgi:hypothetical protein
LIVTASLPQSAFVAALMSALSFFLLIAYWICTRILEAFKMQWCPLCGHRLEYSWETKRIDCQNCDAVLTNPRASDAPAEVRILPSTGSAASPHAPVDRHEVALLFEEMLRIRRARHRWRIFLPGVFVVPLAMASVTGGGFIFVSTVWRAYFTSICILSGWLEYRPDLLRCPSCWARLPDGSVHWNTIACPRCQAVFEDPGEAVH